MKMLITVAGMLMIGTLMYSQSVITVNPATEYQTILGLGGHGYSTDANYNKYLIDLMGLSGYRHWVESEDTSKYVTLADITNGTIPFRDLNANAIASFATMKAKGVNFVIATNWSPPACLKNNNCVQQMCIRDRYTMAMLESVNACSRAYFGFESRSAAIL